MGVIDRCDEAGEDVRSVMLTWRVRRMRVTMLLVAVALYETLAVRMHF